MNAASVTAFPRRIPPTILIVDDDAIARCLVSDELRTYGFKVLEARSADDAFTVLDTVRIDLLLVDIHLPGPRNGLDVARVAQVRLPPTQIILASGKEDGSAIPDLDSLGLFVRKPYFVSQMVDLVARCLNWPEFPKS